MKTRQPLLATIGLIGLIGGLSTIVWAQAIVEMALNIPPGFWAGIDSQSGAEVKLSIAPRPNAGGAGGGGGGGVFILVGTSSFFPQCERISEGKGFSNGTARIINGVLVSRNWTLTCVGEDTPVLENQRVTFSLIRGSDQLLASLPDQNLVFNRLSNRIKPQGRGNPHSS